MFIKNVVEKNFYCKKNIKNFHSRKFLVEKKIPVKKFMILKICRIIKIDLKKRIRGKKII